MTIIIRPAGEADLPGITAIYNEAILTTTATFDTEVKSIDNRREWLSAHDERHIVLVAEVDGQVVGWASLSKWSERPAYSQTAETSFYVNSAHRGRGVGRQLKMAIIAHARQVGFHTLIARVAEESAVSLHLNDSLGFQHVGTLREVGQKFGKRLGVHILQLMLSPVGGPDSPAPAPMVDLKYRLAGLDDCALLARLNQQLIQDEGHRNPMTVEQLEQRMKDWLAGEYRAVLFESSVETIAYGLYRDGPQEIYLRQFYVVRSQRRQGFGKAAFEILRTQIWPTGKRLTVEVLCHNTAAVAFWRAVGYRDYSLTLEISPDQPV